MTDAPPKTLEERVAALEQAVFAPPPAAALEHEAPDPLAEGYRRFKARQEKESQ